MQLKLGGTTTMIDVAAEGPDRETTRTFLSRLYQPEIDRQPALQRPQLSRILRTLFPRGGSRSARR